MNRYTCSDNNQKKPQIPTQGLKEKYLRKLEGALFSEAYEQCAGLIRLAKTFGAAQAEVQAVLDEHTAGIEGGSKIKGGTSPRF
jgi:hypothetical protein